MRKSDTEIPAEHDPLTQGIGTEKPWYQGWNLTEAERDVFRQRSRKSNQRKVQAMRGEGRPSLHPINVPKLDPADLMPQLPTCRLRSLSLFSGGGGLDLGFDRAGFAHVASYELLRNAADTLRLNRPDWAVFGGSDGDVRHVDWKKYRGLVDVVHGGPPCQPFSSSGRQLGSEDVRDMFPEFVRAVREIEPLAFVAENVPALLQTKFESYVEQTVRRPLSRLYTVDRFEITAESVGVPQVRRRVIFVGVQKHLARAYKRPIATHRPVNEEDARQSGLFDSTARLPVCMGAREALGLPSIGHDGLVPTLRSGLTGPRHTTSVLSSVSAQRIFERLQIWPNGVARTRERASIFVAENGHFRLSIPDCGLLQGFPETWRIDGAVYMALGQIGNSVVPPVGYAIARSIRAALT